MADELISREVVIKLFKEIADCEWNKDCAPISWSHAYEQAIDHIEEIPTVNAVVLPCKGGDTLYSKDGKVAEVEEFHIDKHAVHMTVSFECDYNCVHCAFNTWRQEYSGEYSCEGEWGEMTIPADEVGKTVFLTREEAEKALERGEDNATNKC